LTKASGRHGDITSIVTVDDRQRRREHFDIRYDVFVDEQGIFTDTDEDIRDSDPSTIHLIGLINRRTVGAVRLYPLDVGCEQWQGDRLAVLKAHRTSRLGFELVQEAVAQASANGGSVMHAHIQLPNVRFFEYLGWHLEGPVETYAGIVHQQMAINLKRESSKSA
jgi:putative N-acetyltransferase (TIGR04045 family)